MKRQEKPFCNETDAAQRVTFELKEIIAAPANPEPDKAVETSSIEVGLRDEPLMTESRVREIVREFPPADPLFVAVMAAYTSRVDLSMKLHYLSCESGVGRARREKPDA